VLLGSFAGGTTRTAFRQNHEVGAARCQSSFCFCLATTVTVTALVPALARSAAADSDPLPSWNEGAAKRAIVEFVGRVTDPASPDHVPAAERVAVFDNDGTLWPEYPLPFQAAFAVDRIRERATAEPALRDDPMVKALLAGDPATLLAGDRHEGLLHVVGLTHADLTVDAFQQGVATWMETAKHSRFHRPYDHLTYQPMQEPLAFLRANGFKTWIVSGGGADFMRVWSEWVYGIPPEQVIGSTGRTRFEMRDDGPPLVKTLEHLFVDDKAGRESPIHRPPPDRLLRQQRRRPGDAAIHDDRQPATLTGRDRASNRCRSGICLRRPPAGHRPVCGGGRRRPLAAAGRSSI
jgi:hypothetical protein